MLTELFHKLDLNHDGKLVRRLRAVVSESAAAGARIR